ncbi:MAG: Alcohol dehydrogenase (quinone), cytochrome c subunit [Haliscomenobacter sp.]|nr:Alcohol dehydrogenase (quinone), cytochrome c subunit [Haliscomenobacter sp.]
MKILKIILLSIVLIILGFVLYVQLSWTKTYDAPYPEIKASADSAVIARGRYLAYSIAHCASCHGPGDRVEETLAGAELPMSGGMELEVPGFVLIRFPNITPDKETGIGKRTDAQLARSLRHSVGYDGRPLMPFMPFQEMSDEDLTAVISFLRAQPAVYNNVEPLKYTFLGKALLSFGMLKPEGPKNTPPKSMDRAPTAAYGKYLAYSVGNCKNCHTEMDSKGQFVGPEFAGGAYFAPDNLTKGYSFVSPNLTPDPATGVLANWTQEEFISRFKSGRVHQRSPMPWEFVAKMDTVDLVALYQFLSGLKPVARKVEKTVFKPGEKYTK